jgi:hypothetical protein
MGKKTNREERLKQIVRQLSGKVNIDDEPVPEVAIKGKGHIMCFNSSKRMFIRIARGTKAYVIDPEMNSEGRVMIYTFSGSIVEIKPEELVNTGFD